MVRDRKPESTAEKYIELDEDLWPDDSIEVVEEPGVPAAPAPVPALPGGDAEMPAPFEYPFDD